MSAAVVTSPPIERHGDCAGPRDPARGANHFVDQLDNPSASQAKDNARPNATRKRISLIDQTNPDASSVMLVDADQFFIGRDPGCQLCLPSPFVSRQHVMIEYRDGSVFVSDLGSRNGTLHNGRLFRGEAVAVAPGDRLEIGFSRFTIAFQECESANDATISDWLIEKPAAGRFAAAPQDAQPCDSPPATDEAPVVDAPTALAHLRCEVTGDVLIVTLLTQRLDAEPSVYPVRTALLSLLERRLPRHQVVNLEHVHYLSERAAGVLLAYAQHVHEGGGSTRICGLGQEAASVHIVDRLSLLYEIFPTCAEAMSEPWP